MTQENQTIAKKRAHFNSIVIDRTKRKVRTNVSGAVVASEHCMVLVQQQSDICTEKDEEGQEGRGGEEAY